MTISRDEMEKRTDARSLVFLFLRDRNEDISMRVYIEAVAKGTGLTDDEIRAAVGSLRADGFINRRFRLHDRKGKREKVKRRPAPKNAELFP